MSVDDLLRARAIEMLMCDFRLDRDALRRDFGAQAATLAPTLAMIAERYGDLVTLTEDHLAVEPQGRPLTRIIASALDTHLSDNERFSHAS